MEASHHILMSAKWLREQGLPEECVRETMIWCAWPDLVKAIVPDGARTYIHLEEDLSCRGQLHATREDLSRVYLLPCLPPSHNFACASRIGVHLHLVQDRAYDRWISRYIGQRAGDTADSGYVYWRLDTGTPLTPVDVAYTKRWSWRQGYLDACGEYLSEDEKMGVWPRYLEEEIMPHVMASPYWDPRMESGMHEFWEYSMRQIRLPDAMRELCDDMSKTLSYALTEWQAELST